MKPRVYLIDGSALAYRSYFAFANRPLINSKGENTSAAFGVINTLLALMKKERPDYAAVVFDSREPTFRHVRYPAYKANREKMPEDMQSQLPRIFELIRAMGLKIIQASGFEADDVMGTLARRFADRGLEVVLVSGDKDFCQLVDESIKVLNPGKAGQEPRWIDRNCVLERFGVEPEKIVDVFALMGDASDNIPGVPGIGEKTASRLVSRYGGLEEILARLPIADEVRASEKLSRFSDQARLSRELASIELDAPVSFEPEELRPGESRSGTLRSLLEELEFKKLASSIFEIERSEFSWRELRSEDDVRELLEAIASRKKIGLAVATGGDRLAAPVCIAVAASPDQCFYVHLPRESGELFARLANPALLSPLLELLANPEVTKCTHDVKSTLNSLSAVRGSLRGKIFDAMLAAYLIDPSEENGLGHLVGKFLGSEWENLNSFLGASRGSVSPEEVPPEKLGQYVCGCAVAASKLEGAMLPLLSSMNLGGLYEEVELPIAQLLSSMERTGVFVDVGFLEQMSTRLGAEMADAERKIFELAGCQFNLNSPNQLSAVLFEHMGLPVVRKTRKTKAPSTDEGALEELAAHHEVAREIIKHRQLSKLKNTYVDVFPRLLNPSTGRLHASFNQAVTATGRLSMSDPNLQNIPARTRQGREIRKAFTTAEKGWILLSADYSQIELRLLAHLSGDRLLKQAFNEGIDVHASTASSLFGVPEDDVPSELRARAKVVNFGIIYGMSPFGLSKELGIATCEAKEFIDNYYRLYPAVGQYIQDSIDSARKYNCAFTMLGRRRPIAGLASRNARIRQEAERMAINTPIQGSAADMIKLAMLAISREIGERGLSARPTLQIHDELLFELPESEREELTLVVRKGMENAVPLSVPVRVDIGVGENWFETH